jgi:hypothetical protein
MPTVMKPLYVRLPEADAERLDAVAAATGRSKRQLVGEALRGHLDADEPDSRGQQLTVGRIELREPPVDVMTLPEVASLLRLEERNVEVSAVRGELPGRFIGGEWRFAPAAVLAWLGHEPT